MVEARPVAQSNDFSFLGSEPAQQRQYLCHRSLIVQSPCGVVVKVIYERRLRQLRQKTLVTAHRPVGVADRVVGHREQPRQDGLCVEANCLPETPRLQEHDTRKFLCA